MALASSEKGQMGLGTKEPGKVRPRGLGQRGSGDSYQMQSVRVTTRPNRGLGEHGEALWGRGAEEMPCGGSGRAEPERVAEMEREWVLEVARSGQ